MFTNYNVYRQVPALMHAETLRPRDATELKNNGMIKLGDVNYQSEVEPNLSIFPKAIYSTATPVSVRVYSFSN